MSQRLHIGKTSETFYDCVLVSEFDASQKLLLEWLAYSEGWYLSPFKIRISDVGLFRQLEPLISAVLEKIGKQYPDDVWTFYLGDASIEHPTAEELLVWLSAKEK